MGGVPSKPDFERFDRPLAIGAGYSRTGTNSMQLALEKLYDALCQHGGTHLLSREDAWGKLWCTAMKQQRHGQKEEVLKAVREGCRGFAALTDMPAILFVEELYYDPKKPGQEKWLEHYTSHPRTSLATGATSRHKGDDWKGTFPEEGKHSPEGKIA